MIEAILVLLFIVYVVAYGLFHEHDRSCFP